MLKYLVECWGPYRPGWVGGGEDEDTVISCRRNLSAAYRVFMGKLRPCPPVRPWAFSVSGAGEAHPVEAIGVSARNELLSG